MRWIKGDQEAATIIDMNRPTAVLNGFFDLIHGIDFCGEGWAREP